jgi:hypothetical protein
MFNKSGVEFMPLEANPHFVLNNFEQGNYFVAGAPHCELGAALEFVNVVA